jgi:hypothetical protein
MQMKLLGITNVDFDTIGQRLIRSSISIRNWRKSGSIMVQSSSSPSVAPQPKYEPWPLLGFFSLEDSQQISFYSVRLSASRPAPNLDDQASIFIPLGDRVAQLYHRTLVSSGTSGSPFPVPTYMGP